jgi:hypothetical protein
MPQSISRGVQFTGWEVCFNCYRCKVRKKNFFFRKETEFRQRNELRGKTENIENYMDFHISKLARLYISLVLFTLNFADPVNPVLVINFPSDGQL